MINRQPIKRKLLYTNYIVYSCSINRHIQVTARSIYFKNPSKNHLSLRELPSCCVACYVVSVHTVASVKATEQ